jgi:hypothetical protein
MTFYININRYPVPRFFCFLVILARKKENAAGTFGRMAFYLTMKK